MASCNYLLQLWYLTFMNKLLLLWFMGVFLEMVLCSPEHDIHRIVLKTHYRRIRDRDVQKNHSSQQTRKPSIRASSEPFEDDWYLTTKSPRTNSNKNYRTQQYRSGIRRGSPRSTTATTTTTTTTEKSTNLADALEITKDMSLPVFEETFSKYNRPNNRSSASSRKLKLKQDNNVSSSNQHELAEKNKLNNGNSKGYEVYEEIIDDTNPPPPPPRINIHSIIPFFAVVTPKDEDNHIKETISNYTEASTKIYGKRTKPRRGRSSNVKLE